MATKNSNEEDMMLRLSNHVNGISLILDIVDVNSFPYGSKLQKVIARQLIALRARISNIPVVSTGTNAGQNARQSPATHGPGVPKPTASKGPVKFAPPAPQQLSPTEEGWRILNDEQEANNFAVDSYNNFYCYVCERSMHANNLLSHIRGKTHNKNSAEEEEEEEEEEEGAYYGGHSSDGYNDYNGSDEHIDNMIDEMDEASNERRIEIMWDVIYAVDHTIDNIEPNGRWFYCRLCNRTLNGPFPVVDHVRGSAHNAG